uniref:Ferric uptake regulation protein n=1 Tax=candidate division WOR-3 bacterium TaxID=2052148 RepID=A0A7C4TGD1_UNCW3
MKIKVKNNYEIRKLENYKMKKGLKSSSKRATIIEYFLKQNQHLSAEELRSRLKKLLPGIGYSTVYRALKLLSDCGLAKVRHFEKGKTSFEPVHKKGHHDHLICTRCGRIIEFTNYEIEKLQKKITRKFKFKVKDHKLEIYGLCQKCYKEERKNGAS